MDEAARLAALLDRSERIGVATLRFEELRELGGLYRLLTARLAHLRERGDDPAAIRHLNALCVRAFTLLYGRSRPRRELLRVWMQDIPHALGRTWRFQVAAWALLLAGMGIGLVLASEDPQSVRVFVPAEMGYQGGTLDRLIDSPDARAAFLERERVAAARNFMFGSFLFAHNTRVGLLSFATGMLAAIPTVLLQIYNGLLLGAFSWIFLRDPWPMAFLAWILPHGIPELTAISLCAAAGLQLGNAVAAPGRAGRRRALRDATSPALLLFVASLPLFLTAALIESFVRESTLGTVPRFLVAGAVCALIVWGMRVSRRHSDRPAVDVAWIRQLLPLREARDGE